MFLFDMNINTNVILVYRLLLKLLLKVRLLLELLSCPLRNWVFFKVNLIDKGQFSVSWASLVTQMVKNLPTMQETRVWSLCREDPLEEEMATHSSSCLENPMDRGAWQATIHRDAQNQTQLKRHSTHTRHCLDLWFSLKWSSEWGTVLSVSRIYYYLIPRISLLIKCISIY